MIFNFILTLVPLQGSLSDILIQILDVADRNFHLQLAGFISRLIPSRRNDAKRELIYFFES